MNHEKVYIGDGVYAQMDEFGMLRLTTENGIATTNEIFLEPEVWNALVGYMQRINTQAAIELSKVICSVCKNKVDTYPDGKVVIHGGLTGGECKGSGRDPLNETG